MSGDEVAAFFGSLSLADGSPIGVLHFGGFLGLKVKYKPSSARTT